MSDKYFSVYFFVGTGSRFETNWDFHPSEGRSDFTFRVTFDVLHRGVNLQRTSALVHFCSFHIFSVLSWKSAKNKKNPNSEMGVEKFSIELHSIHGSISIKMTSFGLKFGHFWSKLHTVILCYLISDSTFRPIFARKIKQNSKSSFAPYPSSFLSVILPSSLNNLPSTLLWK